MKREIRASSAAGVAGVGAIVDVGQESFLIPGIANWREKSLSIITLARLSSRLGKILKSPGATRDPLEVTRFPRAMFCEKCRKVFHWKVAMESEGREPVCQANGCNGSLVPMRFVVACESGHLDDVPWAQWAHSDPNNGNRSCRRTDALSFDVDTAATTTGLSSLMISCACGSSRSLGDLTNPKLTRPLFGRCKGRHPWIFGNEETCSSDPVVLQRGATNLHYASMISALDIPVALVDDDLSAFAGQVRAHASYAKLLALVRNTDGDNRELIESRAEIIAEDIGCPADTVERIVRAEAAGEEAGEISAPEREAVDQNEILDEEWQTLSSIFDSGSLIGENFNAQSEAQDGGSPQWLKSLVKDVILIRRLREVRAYLGFQRVRPAGPDKTVPPDVGEGRSWLPAAEVFGEGIVLKLDYDRLEAWATTIKDSEREAVAALEQKRLDENFWFLPSISPGFLAIHTLSHLLIRRITFECGYSSSSLRERLYFSPSGRYAGIMIFTADGDSEGSLGGLVRQGRADRLAQSIAEAIAEGSWCSSDPVCTETAGQGLGGFNHGACHACALVSETSCTAANTLLDRRMLFDPSWGLLPYLGWNE